MLTELQTEKQATIHFGKKNPLILLFTYCSLQIKFILLLERKPSKFQGKIIATAVLDKDENCLW